MFHSKERLHQLLLQGLIRCWIQSVWWNTQARSIGEMAKGLQIGPYPSGRIERKKVAWEILWGEASRNQSYTPSWISRVMVRLSVRTARREWMCCPLPARTRTLLPPPSSFAIAHFAESFLAGTSLVKSPSNPVPTIAQPSYLPAG